MKRRLSCALLLGLFALLGACSREGDGDREPATRSLGLVSLSPAITETLFAIDADDGLRGVSNYCRLPDGRDLPRLGSGISPAYEAIARLNPGLIVTEDNESVRAAELRALAPTELLPWLTLAEVLSSTQRLGKLTGHEREASELTARLRERLEKKSPPEAAPRVLLVLGYAPGKLSEVWFVRDNSLHGAALRAAGGVNAVADAVSGLPRLSLEHVVALDPELVIVLVDERTHERDRQRILESWAALSALKAVSKKRLGVLHASEAFSNGPGILTLVDRLEAEIKRLGARR
jgi:iron complex transport system substrate-binding protein